MGDHETAMVEPEDLQVRLTAIVEHPHILERIAVVVVAHDPAEAMVSVREPYGSRC